jgi:gentisate 1,2-dioxygenase
MVQEIEPGGFSGRHRHIAEEVLLVLEGEGYDLHEDTRLQWRAGDIICVPTMASHQHYCTGDRPARLVSVWPRERMHQFIGGFEQLADASGWAPA